MSIKIVSQVAQSDTVCRETLSVLGWCQPDPIWLL